MGSAEKPLVMLIEDDEVIMDALGALLESEGYRVERVYSGRRCIALATNLSPAVIVLDLGLHDMDALIILEVLLGWTKAPILVLNSTWQGRLTSKALAVGADDYLVRPFSNEAFLGRITSMLRCGGAGDAPAYRRQALAVDPAAGAVTLKGEGVPLTDEEARLMAYLARHAGLVRTTGDLMRELWGPYGHNEATLKYLMAGIRRKLEKNPADPEYILSDLGVGYRLAPADPPPAPG